MTKVLYIVTLLISNTTNKSAMTLTSYFYNISVMYSFQINLLLPLNQGRVC